MNWYKFSAFELQFFNDRNVINDRIKFFELTTEYLNKLAKVIFQNGVLARSVNQQIMNHKKISSYPVLRDILIQADNIALDSPWKFAAFCKIAIDEVNKKIIEWKKERKEFTEKTLPERMKGFTDAT